MLLGAQPYASFAAAIDAELALAADERFEVGFIIEVN